MNNQSPSPGFAVLRPVEEAWAWIEQHAPIPQIQMVDWQEAEGFVLAHDVIAPNEAPGFPLAMIDGYALRAIETLGAGVYNPLDLLIVGEASPGQPFRGGLPAGSAVRIAGGGPLPDGADAVLPLEQVEEREGRLEVTTVIAPGENVRRAAAEFSLQALLLRADHMLRIQDIGLLGAAGVERVNVFRRPRVRVIAIGSELKSQNGSQDHSHVPDINTVMLNKLIVRDGGELEQGLLVPDDDEAIREALTSAGADIILAAGGSGLGFNDRVARIVSRAGDLIFHGLALQPAKSAGIGHIGGVPAFLLPGAPPSCLIAYDFFAGRAIRLAGGRGGDWPYMVRQAMISKKIVSGLGRVDYIPVEFRNGRAEPLSSGGMPSLTVLAKADGFLVVPALSEGFAAEATVSVYFFGGIHKH